MGVCIGLVAPGVAGAALAAVPAMEVPPRERSRAWGRAGMAGGAVNTVRQLGYALGVAGSGTVLTSRMRDTLPHDAAHTLAGGGAGALRGTYAEPVLRGAFTSGLDAALVTAGFVGTAAGVPVLALVRTGGAERAGVTESAAPALTEEAPTSRG